MPEIGEEPLGAESTQGNFLGSVSRAERDRASQKRDAIAKEMWASYQKVTQHRQ